MFKRLCPCAGPIMILRAYCVQNFRGPQTDASCKYHSSRRIGFKHKDF